MLKVYTLAHAGKGLMREETVSRTPLPADAVSMEREPSRGSGHTHDPYAWLSAVMKG